jgi:hypothetical protein
MGLDSYLLGREWGFRAAAPALVRFTQEERLPTSYPDHIDKGGSLQQVVSRFLYGLQKYMDHIKFNIVKTNTSFYCTS